MGLTASTEMEAPLGSLSRRVTESRPSETTKRVPFSLVPKKYGDIAANDNRWRCRVTVFFGHEWMAACVRMPNETILYHGSSIVTMTLHATLIFERDVPAPIEKVFAAFADLRARCEWGAPSDTAVLIYDEADFREGGQDRFRCGAKANPNIHGVTRYLDIVANRRVVSSETISMDGRRLCASLTTLELAANGDTTKLTSTTQLASFVGNDMVKGHEAGTNASLDNLVRYFQAKR